MIDLAGKWLFPCRDPLQRPARFYSRTEVEYGLKSQHLLCIGVCSREIRYQMARGSPSISRPVKSRVVYAAGSRYIFNVF